MSTERPYWELNPVPGPASLLEMFAQRAVEEYVRGKDLSDETFGLVLDVASLAARVVCAGAGVDDSWSIWYQQIVAPLLASEGVTRVYLATAGCPRCGSADYRAGASCPNCLYSDGGAA